MTAKLPTALAVEFRCGLCDVVQRLDDGSPQSRPWGWWPEPAADGRLVCLGCRREDLGTAPPRPSRKVRDAAARREAREAAEAEHPDWPPELVADFLGIRLSRSAQPRAATPKATPRPPPAARCSAVTLKTGRRCTFKAEPGEELCGRHLAVRTKAVQHRSTDRSTDQGTR